MKLNHIEAGGPCRHVVRYVQEIAAGGAANAIFDSCIFVAFLLYHRVVIHYVAESVDGNIVIGDREESAGQDKSQDFFSFGGDP